MGVKSLNKKIENEIIEKEKNTPRDLNYNLLELHNKERQQHKAYPVHRSAKALVSGPADIYVYQHLVKHKPKGFKAKT